MTAPTVERSPWEAALGDRVDELSPGLRAYFGAIPHGCVGRGRGQFERVGTPRRWLWPVLALLAVDGIVFPVWQRRVPFEVENRSDGMRLHGIRRFAFSEGARTMVDTITADGATIVDRLGRHGLVEARFHASVIGGALVLRSVRTALRIGRLRVALPFGPRVELVERTAGERQRVSLVMTSPLLGRIYEYAGEFDYRVETA